MIWRCSAVSSRDEQLSCVRYGPDKEQNSAADYIRQYSSFAGPEFVPPILEILHGANDHTTEQLISIQRGRIERRIDDVNSPIADMLRSERFANWSKEYEAGIFDNIKGYEGEFG